MRSDCVNQADDCRVNERDNRCNRGNPYAAYVPSHPPLIAVPPGGWDGVWLNQ